MVQNMQMHCPLSSPAPLLPASTLITTVDEDDDEMLMRRQIIKYYLPRYHHNFSMHVILPQLKIK